MGNQRHGFGYLAFETGTMSTEYYSSVKCDHIPLSITLDISSCLPSFSIRSDLFASALSFYSVLISFDTFSEKL